jgi:hypothetical protein
MSVDFVLLALTATFNIVCHPCGHAGLPEVSSYLTESFILAWVFCGWRIMGVSHDALFEFKVWRDNQFAHLGPFRDTV